MKGVGRLSGRTVLVTRSRAQSGPFSQQLEAAGASVLELPMIEILPQPAEELDSILREAPEYQWIVFTSSNAVKFLLGRAHETDQMELLRRGQRICAIGPATAQALVSAGLEVDLVPESFQGEGALESLEALMGGHLAGVRILLPRAAKAREILPDELRKRGARVDIRVVYTTVSPPDRAETLREILRSSPPDIVTVTSSSTVHNLVALADDLGLLRSLSFASIGPITTRTAREYGLSVVVQAEESTTASLAEAIIRHFAAGTSD